MYHNSEPNQLIPTNLHPIDFNLNNDINIIQFDNLKKFLHINTNLKDGRKNINYLENII